MTRRLDHSKASRRAKRVESARAVGQARVLLQRRAPRPPTHRQLAVIDRLAAELGRTLGRPATRRAAFALIQLLKKQQAAVAERRQ